MGAATIMRNRFLNPAAAFAASDAHKIADTTATRVAPAASTSSRFNGVMPPMAKNGAATRAATCRTNSTPTGYTPGFVPVANTGPTPM